MVKKLYEKINTQQIHDPISQKFDLDLKFSQKPKTQYGEGEEKSNNSKSQIPKKKQTKEKTPLYEQMLRKKWLPKSNLWMMIKVRALLVYFNQSPIMSHELQLFFSKVPGVASLSLSVANLQTK